MKTLHPFGTIPNVTRLDQGTFGARPRQPGQVENLGPVRSTPIQFALVGAAPAYVLAVANPRRIGLILQNRDTAGDMFFNFGADANVSSGRIAPGGFVLLDFVCPTDMVTVFAAVNVSGYYVEFSKAGV